jgi:hypothetical protein
MLTISRFYSLSLRAARVRRTDLACIFVYVDRPQDLIAALAQG